MRNLLFFRLLVISALPLCLHCGGDDDGEVLIDSGLSDASEDVSEVDSGPECPLTCGALEGCCIIDGQPECVDIRDNDDHCGTCGFECNDTRGTHCENMACVCGSSELGCRGDETSFCCPARSEGGERYCANLLTSGRDCGECGNVCDGSIGNECVGGRCSCGGETCEGTRDSMCCEGDFGFTCADLDENPRHCGRCGNVCDIAMRETCVEGECVPIGGGGDAGMPDGGDEDAGVEDGGTSDGGTTDGGVEDGGTADGSVEGDSGAEDGGAADAAPSEDAGPEVDAGDVPDGGDGGIIPEG